MSYTVKEVREAIEGLSDDTPVFGLILTPQGLEIESPFEPVREPTKEEWALIVQEAEDEVGDNCWTELIQVFYSVKAVVEGELVNPRY